MQTAIVRNLTDRHHSSPQRAVRAAAVANAGPSSPLPSGPVQDVSFSDTSLCLATGSGAMVLSAGPDGVERSGLRPSAIAGAVPVSGEPIMLQWEGTDVRYRWDRTELVNRIIGNAVVAVTLSDGLAFLDLAGKDRLEVMLSVLMDHQRGSLILFWHQ